MRTALLSVVVLLLLTAGARAENVDWSDYLEPKGAAPTRLSTAPTPTVTKSRAKRVNRPKSVAAKGKKAKARAAKARAKKKGRR